jgi:capsule polysaccharide export protein KpsE/RkpR
VENLRQVAVVPEVDIIRDDELQSTTGLAEPLPSSEWPAYLPLLAEKRRVLYRTAVWALVVSTIIAFVIPKHYESTATIMPPDSFSSTNGSSMMMMAALAGKATPGLTAMAGNVLGVKSTGALYVDLLRSRTVEDHIVERFSLQSVYWIRYKQDARKVLDERTGVSEDRKSGVITIVVMDHNPQRAHDMAHAFVEELNNLLSRVSTSSAHRERVFIEQRLVSVKSDLDDAEKQFSVFASRNNALDIKEQAKAMVEAGAVLQGQLIAAQSELEGLHQVYADSNVRVRAARARIDELKRQLQKMGGSDAAIASDGPAPGELYPPIRKLPLLGVEWADLYRRLKIQETVYELLNQQYELARIQEAKEIPTVNVIDAANLPEKKSWPPRLVLIALLTALALAGAAVNIVGSERVRSLRVDDPRRQLAMSAAETFGQIRNRIANRAFFNRSNGSKSSTDEAE